MAGVTSPARIENPDRLQRFIETAFASRVADEPLPQRLQRVASALDDLISAEIRYYYRSRKWHARVSAVSRVVAWTTGTIGLLLPLVGAAADGYATIANWGYVFLGASAAALAANTLFGGSATHARNTAAQLELERLLVRYRLRWLRLQSAADASSDSLTAAAFDLFEQFAEDAATVIAAETDQWSAALQKAIDTYSTAASRPPAR